MDEADVRLALAHPLVAFCTDSSARATDGILGEEKSHPRAWGSATRILGHYVREEKVLSLEEAVRKMTSLPAARAHLLDRGLVIEVNSALYHDALVDQEADAARRTALVDAGFRVVAFDAPSHGGSGPGPEGPGRSNILEFADALVAAGFVDPYVLLERIGLLSRAAEGERERLYRWVEARIH